MTTRTISLPMLLALLFGVIAWSGTTMTAYAGGPTSVLLVNPLWSERMLSTSATPSTNG